MKVIHHEYLPFVRLVDPETNKRCGKFMRNWDEMFYESSMECAKIVI